MSSYVDAHHHIWPATGLPWLDGPMIPRIFGPYEPLQGRAYTIDAYSADARANGFGQSVYVQANWALEDSLKEVEWVQGEHDRTGWPHAIVGSADLFAPDALETIHAQLAASPLLRGTRLQLHWHENPAFRFASAPDRAQDPVLNANLAQLPGLGLVFELQVFPNQVASATRLVADHPDLTFVLIHAGMPIAGEPWREALAALAEHPNVHVKLSGQGTFVHRVDREWIAEVTRTVLDTFGSGRAMFGSNFPVESLWTDFSSLIDAWLGVLAEYPEAVRADVLGGTARRVYRLQEEVHG
ncbi:MAG TPA: amidohydrolase family protein [Solirubrobacter sp.]|nr:amidohydrolase family protein [Solirubrobacter sp.]